MKNIIFTSEPNRFSSNRAIVNRNIYRNGGKPTTGLVKVKTGFTGEISDSEYNFAATYPQVGGRKTDIFKISVNVWGDKGEIILIEPGVPSNNFMMKDIQRNLSPFFRTVSMDMLGMGRSDKPLNYGKDQIDEHIRLGHKVDTNPWDWINDVDYTNQVMEQLYPGEKFTYLCSDWGGGIGVHFAAKYNHRLNALILLDPIAGDGYPVPEIQAIGRSSKLPVDKFMMAMGAADQTLTQIFKTMVHNPDNIWNRYTISEILYPYSDQDYDRNANDINKGEDASSKTLRIKYVNLKVLADRAAVLAPAQLVPISENIRGVDYEKIICPTLIIWGAQDNMMPPNQAYRFLWQMPNSRVEIQMVENAGHFVELDQPDRVSEIVINFIARELGKSALADIFLGYTGIWKGDEQYLINKLREKYNK